jgi:hypothetical protein
LQEKEKNPNKKERKKQTNSNVFEGNDEENCIRIVVLLALVVTCMFGVEI